MTPKPQHGTPDGDATLAIQKLARETGSDVQELQTLYVLEALLARIATSPHRNDFVLKGGVLLAAFAARRPTKDIDLQATGFTNDIELPRVVPLDQPPVTLLGYPLAMMLAEKIVTALDRGGRNTRWRDFADVYTLTRLHSVEAGTLRNSREDGAALRHALDRTSAPGTGRRFTPCQPDRKS